jgi:lysophospholipase L1-like esterase
VARWLTALVGLCALLGCGLLDRGPTTTEEIGIESPANASEDLALHYTERVLLFHETYTEPMNGGVAFVGDSITEDGDWATLFPDQVTRNYGISGDTTVGLHNRFVQLVAARPGKVFLLIGTNDFNNDQRPPAEIIANYERLVDRFARELPQTRLYIQAVLPREAHNAAGVLEINEGLRRIAEARGVAYVDIYTPFVVGGGVLDPAVTDDQLHLNTAGYARWRDIIAPLVLSP